MITAKSNEVCTARGCHLLVPGGHPVHQLAGVGHPEAGGQQEAAPVVHPAPGQQQVRGRAGSQVEVAGEEEGAVLPAAA